MLHETLGAAWEPCLMEGGEFEPYRQLPVHDEGIQGGQDPMGPSPGKSSAPPRASLLLRLWEMHMQCLINFIDIQKLGD